MTEMKIAMVKLLQKFKVEFDETTKIDLVNGDMFLFNFSHLNIRFVERYSDGLLLHIIVIIQNMNTTANLSRPFKRFK